jgi:3-hydroxypropanoate dehydrogenase
VTTQNDTLRTLFHDARTFHHWQDRPVSDEVLVQLYEAIRFGPTALNSTPIRLVFVKSAAAKEKLKPALNPGNVDKTMNAPVTVIAAYDTSFHEHLPQLFPGRDMKPKFDADGLEAREKLASYNAALETGYLIAAARALGLDAGPMGGFDKAKVDEAFLAGTTWKSALLINLGYGDRTKLHPRLPRLEFKQAARIE